MSEKVFTWIVKIAVTLAILAIPVWVASIIYPPLQIVGALLSTIGIGALLLMFLVMIWFN